MNDIDADSEKTRNVFVVYGRNLKARRAMFEFLRSIGLTPLEWSMARELTGEPSPYIGTILDTAFGKAQAIVVLFTPDEIVRLRAEYAEGEHDPDLVPATQARPNVLFEAGMAMGRHSSRTVLVELGRTRGFSDIAGRHALRMSNNPQKRQELAERLRSAGCAVNLSGADWYESGDFTAPPDIKTQSASREAEQQPATSSNSDTSASTQVRRIVRRQGDR